MLCDSAQKLSLLQGFAVLNITLRSNLLVCSPYSRIPPFIGLPTHLFSQVSLERIAFSKFASSVIYGSFDSIKLSRCLFSSSIQPLRTVISEGKAISNTTSSISDTIFVDCLGTNEDTPGGAISCVNSTIHIDRSSFKCNTAFSAGAASFYKCILFIKDTNFTENSAYDTYGAIDISESSVVFHDSALFANHAKSSAGAGRIESSSIMATALAVISNYGTQNTGGFYIVLSQGSISHSEFVENHCPSPMSGGVFYFSHIMKPLVFSLSVFLRNEASPNISTNIFQLRSPGLSFYQCSFDVQFAEIMNNDGENSSKGLLKNCAHNLEPILIYGEMISAKPYYGNVYHGKAPGIQSISYVAFVVSLTSLAIIMVIIVVFSGSTTE